ncbi:MAG: hypothetical protein PHY16_18300 [Methylobacter sp.]|nr:hypothetical protein [Methylobacter sp.]
MQALTHYNQALFELQAATEFDEVKTIRDQAQAITAYAIQAKDTKLL